jgi:hypothetical protein
MFSLQETSKNAMSKLFASCKKIRCDNIVFVSRSSGDINSSTCNVKTTSYFNANLTFTWYKLIIITWALETEKWRRGGTAVSDYGWRIRKEVKVIVAYFYYRIFLERQKNCGPPDWDWSQSPEYETGVRVNSVEPLIFY